MDRYKKLKKQPLTFALAEFRFSPILEIREFIPKIQSGLRKDYPTLAKGIAQVFEVQPDGVAVSNSESWSFLSASRKSAVGIDQQRITFMTSEYPRFDGFSESCGKALNALANNVDLGLLNRVGLRYNDLVRIENDDTLDSLVDDHFGAPEKVTKHGKLQFHTTQTVVATDAGTLSLRTLFGPHNYPCFSDVQNIPIAFDKEADNLDRIILDFDHIWEAKEESVSFNTKVALQKLNQLHETARAAFWDITTDHAKDEKWD